MMSIGETAMSLWPIIRGNTVRIIPNSKQKGEQKPIIPAGNGTIIYANENHIMILTGGNGIGDDFFNKKGNVNVKVKVQFPDETLGRLFEGVTDKKYEAVILTDAHAARGADVVILHVEAAFKKENGVVARFRDSALGLTKGMPILMCANTYGYDRFSHVSGTVSSPYVPRKRRENQSKSCFEHDVAAGSQMRGAGMYDLSGRLIGIHSHQFIFNSSSMPGFYFAGRISEGIPIVQIIPVISKLCRSKGVQVPVGADAYEMLDHLSHNLYGTNITTIVR